MYSQLKLASKPHSGGKRSALLTRVASATAKSAAAAIRSDLRTLFPDLRARECGFHLVRGALPVEAPRVRERRVGHALEEGVVAEQARDAIGEARLVADRYQEAGVAVAHRVAESRR